MSCFGDMPNAHVLVHPESDAPPKRDVVYTPAGNTKRFALYYDPTVTAGPSLCAALSLTCEADLSALETKFATTAPSAFSLYVDTGTFGAYHNTCADTGLHLAAFDGTNQDLVRMLMVAEADEVMMATQGKGWNCGDSAGEALSRVLSTDAYPAQLGEFASAPTWLQGSRGDWITQSDPTDQNYESIGCGALFLNWLRDKRHYTIEQIIAAGGSSLAATYNTLSGLAKTEAFSTFLADVNATFPPGQPVMLATDGAGITWAGGTPAPAPAPTPTPQPTPNPSPVPAPVPQPTPDPTGGGCLAAIPMALLRLFGF